MGRNSNRRTCSCSFSWAMTHFIGILGDVNVCAHDTDVQCSVCVFANSFPSNSTLHIFIHPNAYTVLNHHRFETRNRHLFSTLLTISNNNNYYYFENHRWFALDSVDFKIDHIIYNNSLVAGNRVSYCHSRIFLELECRRMSMTSTYDLDYEWFSVCLKVLYFEIICGQFDLRICSHCNRPKESDMLKTNHSIIASIDFSLQLE